MNDIYDDKLVTKDKNGSVKIELEHSFTFEAEKVKSITIRRPVARDLIDSFGSDNPHEKDIFMFAILAGQPRAMIEGIDLKDLAKINQVYLSFLS